MATKLISKIFKVYIIPVRLAVSQQRSKLVMVICIHQLLIIEQRLAPPLRDSVFGTKEILDTTQLIGLCTARLLEDPS